MKSKKKKNVKNSLEERTQSFSHDNSATHDKSTGIKRGKAKAK